PLGPIAVPLAYRAHVDEYVLFVAAQLKHVVVHSVRCLRERDVAALEASDGIAHIRNSPPLEARAGADPENGGNQREKHPVAGREACEPHWSPPGGKRANCPADAREYPIPVWTRTVIEVFPAGEVGIAGPPGSKSATSPKDFRRA